MIYLFRDVKCSLCNGASYKVQSTSTVKRCMNCGGIGFVRETVDFEEALAQSPIIQDIRGAIEEMLKF